MARRPTSPSRRCSSRPGDGGDAQSRRALPFRPRASPTACSIPASPTTTTARSGDLSRHPPGLLGGRQSVPSPPGPNRLRRAWQRPETIIVHEPWWTATARHADIVLPATTSLERNDLGCAPRDRFVIAMHKAIEPVGEARDDFAIFRDLARAPRLRRRLHRGPRRDGVAAPYLRRLPRARPHQRSIPDFDEFWAHGLARDPAARARNTCCSPISAPIRRGTSSPRRRAGSSSIPSASPASAMTTARRIRPGSSRRNGSARGVGRALRCIWSRASRAIACTARWMPAR